MKKKTTKKPATDGKFEVVPAASLAPAVVPKTTPVSFLSGSDTVPLHNLCHRRGMASAAQSVGWFVLAGVALIQAKKNVTRGEWESWLVDNCEFVPRTAQRYMALAEGVKNKGLKEHSRSFGEKLIRILEKPAGQLDGEEECWLLKSVSRITDGQTLQDLYLDFNILKKPGKLKGGKNNGSTSEPDPNAAVEVARDLIVNPLRKVSEFWSDHWMHLPAEELAELDGLLQDWRSQIKAGAKKGASK